MIIRPAEAQDVDQVIPLVEKITAFHEAHDPARYCFRPGGAQGYRGWLTARATDEHSVFLIAEREPTGAQPAKIVAFLVATTERDIHIYRVDRIGFIHDLWVDDDYRNEGIARQLVTLAVERFGQIGVQQVRLDVLTSNTPAQKLFEACGFRASTIMMLHELNSA